MFSTVQLSNFMNRTISLVKDVCVLSIKDTLFNCVTQIFAIEFDPKGH